MQGPREDSGGFDVGDNPGIKLVERIYNYCQKLYPKTKVMVSGVRRKEGKTCPLRRPTIPISMHSQEHTYVAYLCDQT